MINPDIGAAIDRQSVAIALCPESEVADGVSDHATTPGLNVMDVKAMNDHILHKLQRNLSSLFDVNVGTTSVYGLVACHQQLLGQLDGHAMREGDPQWLLLDDSVAEGPGFRVAHVVIRGVGDNIEPAVLAAGGALAKAEGAVSKALTVFLPIGVASPAAVNGVRG